MNIHLESSLNVSDLLRDLQTVVDNYDWEPPPSMVKLIAALKRQEKPSTI